MTASEDVMRTAVAREKDGYTAAVDRVRADPMLSERGKRDTIAKLYTRSSQRVTEYRERFGTTRDQRHAHLKRHVLGVGDQRDSVGATILLRDANDKVDAVPFGDARALSRLLSSAVSVGDTMMARAVLRRAIDESHGDLVRQYTDAHPDTAGNVDELLSLREPSPLQNIVGDDFGSMAGFAAEFQAFLNDKPLDIDRPAELARYTDTQVEAMADGQDVEFYANFHAASAYPDAQAAGVQVQT